jgi:acylphosphatase
LAEGSHEALLQLLLAVSKGPPSAVVTNVDTDWLDASGEFQSFHVKFS